MSSARNTTKTTTVPFDIGASSGVMMEETAQKSCWAFTARAVIGFAGILVLAYLFGGI
jgi:bacteriorhodopsin